MMMMVPGTRLGPYEILSRIGAGGMGEVFKGHDSKLGRDVAIKVLPAEFTKDPERLARFDREARLLASLSHSNIAHIHGIEHLDGVKFLVMELAHGQTLESRMRGGAIPIDEAIAIARQIAEALDAAHEKGIIHRDLKPANVMLDDEGRVKVLDFGLARATEPEVDEQDLSHSPTLIRAGTHAGVILGTAAYMSPEQARGKRVDKRADIWAFGVVLWEMLNGKRLFEGETVSDTLAAVLRSEVSFAELPPETPARVLWTLRHCLERDPRRRLRDIGDVHLILQEPPAAQVDAKSSGLARPRRMLLLYILLAGLLLGGIGTFTALRSSRGNEELLHVSIPVPQGTRLALSGIQPGPPALSRDGTRIALVLDEPGGSRRIWLRDLQSNKARPLEGTDGASYPFWSPDGAHIGFFAEEKLKRVPSNGGNILVLADAANPKGGTWSRDDVIVFAPAFNSPLYRVSTSGGTPIPITQVDVKGGDSGHRFPEFLDDGKRFLYLVRKRDDAGNRTMLRSLDGKAETKVIESKARVALAGGYLFFLRGRTLLAQKFDDGKAALLGAPVALAENLRVLEGAAFAILQASDQTLMFQTGEARLQRQLVWLDRSGKMIASVGEPGTYDGGSLSADGKTSVVAMDDDIHLVNTSTGTRERLTFEGGDENDPVLSPEGSEVAYRSTEGSIAQHIRVQPIGEGPSRVLVQNSDRNLIVRPSSWSPDGRFLLFEQESLTKNITQLVLLDMESGRRQMVTEVPTRSTGATFSPDGRWIAYCSPDAQARPMIFVAAFPDFQRRWQIAPGFPPLWGSDSRELFFTGSDSRIHSVDVTARSKDSFTWGSLKTHLSAESFPLGIQGDRFLFAQEASVGLDAPLELIVNWRTLVDRAGR